MPLPRRSVHAAAIVVTVVLTAELFVACGSESGTGKQVVVRDSAGIQIVESSSPVWGEGEGWRLADEPSIEIGVLDGEPEYQFYRAFDGARLSDGRIVVANSGSHELRLYDSAGEFLKSSGGEGAGPGEFRSIGMLERFANDSLLTWDWRNNRAQVFDPELEFVRSLRLQGPGDSESGLTPMPIAPLRDGTILTQERRAFMSGSEMGVSRDSLLYFHHDATGALIDTVRRFPSAQVYVSSPGEGRISVSSLAFGRSPQVAVSGDGFYFGASDLYEIRRYTTDGQLVRIIRLERPNLEVTPEDRERYVAERLERADEDWRPRERHMLDEMPFPETMPAYSDIRADPEGNLWVADYRRPGDDQPRWNVFDSDGRWLGTVEGPPGFHVYEIGAHYVLGRHSDEMDVERVRLYDLEKPDRVTRR